MDQAAKASNARYRARAPSGVFRYRSRAEMTAHRYRWTIDLMVAVARQR
jgi:hypothetical protein